MRQPMMPSSFSTVQLDPDLFERCKAPLCTLTHAHSMPNLLLNQWWIHAPGDLMHGDVAAVEGLGPEHFGVDGDVVNIGETAVRQGGDGDALAGIGLNVVFVGGLFGVLIALHAAVWFARTAGVEVCPDPGGGSGGYGGREIEEKSSLLYSSAWVAWRCSR